MWCLATSSLGAVELTFTPSKDNTLFDSDSGAISNGAGEYLFVGKTAQNNGELRRALLAFDINSRIPAGSEISSVSLQLTMTKTIADVQPVSIHKALADWGEGSSNAAGQEGAGTISTANDATWLHRFFEAQPEVLWSNPGGDFESTSLATAQIAGDGDYTWQTPEMIAAVQSWLDRPAENFGWLLLGNEVTTEQQEPATAKRFNSRENRETGTVPRLTVTFTPVVKARFNFTTGILDIFAVEVSGISQQFQATLQQSVAAPDTFTLKNTLPLPLTESLNVPALFSNESGILQLPEVEVIMPDNTTITIGADFQWQTGSEPAIFVLQAVR